MAPHVVLRIIDPPANDAGSSGWTPPTAVSLPTRIRIQFSRDIAVATLKDRVRVKYLQQETADPNAPDTAIAQLTTDYQPVSRLLEIRFATPLEPLRTVQVELLEGIQGTDD